MVILSSPIFVKIASINYTMDPQHLGEENGSHGCCQMNYFQTVDPLKFRDIHSMTLYFLWNLVLSMNTGLWSNPYGPLA